jgi:hypothetical protein
MDACGFSVPIFTTAGLSHSGRSPAAAAAISSAMKVAMIAIFVTPVKIRVREVPAHFVLRKRAGSRHYLSFHNN